MRGNMLGLEVLGLPKLIDAYRCRARPASSPCTRTAAILDLLEAASSSTSPSLRSTWLRALTSLTGISYPTGELSAPVSASEPERLYNLREGFSRADDTLPPRLLSEPATGASAVVSHLEPMLAEYYRGRGGTKTACPSWPSWRS